MANKKNVRVSCFSVTGELIASYESMALGAQASGVSRQAIYNAIKKGTCVNGFRWQYESKRGQ
jgi:predicted DNA-binding protein YlxM (UPF0122 family)